VALAPFSRELLGDFGDERITAIVYAVNLGLLTLVGGVMVE
jgi:hypothetical protein